MFPLPPNVLLKMKVFLILKVERELFIFTPIQIMTTSSLNFLQALVNQPKSEILIKLARILA